MGFIEFLLEDIEHQAGAETTQIKTTVGTYTKCAQLLLGKIKEGSEILDYGAGYGEGTKAMKSIFGDMYTVESYETSPKGWSPNYTRSGQIKKKYDAVVCFNVLNVLPPKLRDEVISNMLALVKEDGYIIIGARAWTSDIALAKNITRAEEDKAVWVHKKDIKAYQKGFDGNELLDYVNSFGSGIEFKKIGNLAKATVIGHKV